MTPLTPVLLNGPHMAEFPHMGAVDPHTDNRTWCRDPCGVPRSGQIFMAGVFVSIERYGFSKKCNRIKAQLFCTNRLTLMRIPLMIHHFNVLYSVTYVHCSSKFPKLSFFE